MLHKLEMCEDMLLVGLQRQMSLVENTTGDLWSSFMPRHTWIKERLDENFYSVEIYPHDYFQDFKPQRRFEKWAALRVEAAQELPEDMKPLPIPSGTYAVFTYVGKASEAPRFYQQIFGEWLPHSDYQLDHRPHLAVMGPNYRPDDPKAEESIWIPVKKSL